MGAVQRVLEKEFKNRHISKSINPDEAVAYGATVQGAIVSGIDDKEVNRMLLLDVIPLSIGVETQGRYNEIIVPKNSTIPVKRTQYFQAAEELQPSIRIKVFEGERPATKDCHYLGEFDISVKPVKIRNSKIRVDLDVTSDGLLKVTAIDCNGPGGEDGGQTLSIKAEQRTLTKEEVDKVLLTADQSIEEDQMFRKISKARSDLRVTLAEATSHMDDKTNYDKIKPVSRAEDFKSYLYNLSIWIDHDVCKHVDEMKAKHKELMTKFNDIMRKPVDTNYKGENDTEKVGDDIDETMPY